MNPGAAADATAQRLLAVIAELLCELRGGEAPAPGLDDDLERHLGIDSLARMELMLRLERAFQVRIAESALQTAETPRELLRALSAAVARDAPGVPVRTDPLSPAAAAADGALPDHARTLLEVLQWHAEHAAARRHVLLLDDGAPAEELSYAALLAQARTLAAGLQRHGVQPDESVALMLPTSLAFLATFMGILLAGAVPMPIYPPLRAAQIEDHLRRVAQVLANGRAVLLIADAQTLPAARILKAGSAQLRAVLSVDRLRAAGGDARAVPRTAQDSALIQYTSGSTGQPKGVVLTHANLLANIRAMGQVLRVGADDVFVSWLPLYHDMGLIGAWLGSLYFRIPLVLMRPQAFLARPSRWLRVISDQRGTLSAAPNFAYEILATKVPDDELQGLDLRYWRAAVNGAEPVHAATLAQFAERLRAHGFDPHAMLPVYGLAECGVGLAFPPLGRGPRVDTIDRQVLHRSGRAQPVDPDRARDAMQVVSCGAPLPGHELRVVDAQGRELPDRHEGRIEFRGPSATAGYFRAPEATRVLYRGDWLDSGDVGYVAEGEIHLTSRAKDLIIRGGHNIHPYDLEAAVGALPGVRRGCVAVFGAADPMSRTERVVVLAETRLVEAVPRAALRARIAQLAVELLGLPADDIVLAGPHAVLKTSSGKVRRAACRALYEQGGLSAPGRSVLRQLLRLWADAVARRLQDPLRRVGDGVAACWMWLLFGSGAALVVPAALLPGRARRAAARGIARAVLVLSPLPLAVSGREHLRVQPAVVVANHASYVDWLVLMAVLPAGAGFVAKRELGGARPWLRWLLVRMGTRFVEREDRRESLEAAEQLEQAARSGETLVIFPEGTLTRAPGLRAFHMGAFVAAARSGRPVLPVSLSGTRSVLRDGSWWPRRHPVQVRIHAPLRPQGRDWHAALSLRDAARDAIGSACGEPLLVA